jgi:hypothetical protein
VECFLRGVVIDDACFSVTMDRIWLILRFQVLSEVWILFQSLFTASCTEATLVPTLEQLVPLPHPNPVLVWDTWLTQRSFHLSALEKAVGFMAKFPSFRGCGVGFRHSNNGGGPEVSWFTGSIRRGHTVEFL